MTTSTTLEPTTTNEGFPERFIQVCPSDNFTLFLQASGDAWACGENSRGQLGNQLTESISTPFIFGRGFVKLDVGQLHAGGLDVNKRLFLWGDGWHGEQGIDPNSISDNANERFISLPTRRANSVIDFALGNARTFFITSEGLIFACGENTDGILGTASSEIHVRNFEIVETPEGLKFEKIDAGMDHFGAIDENGALWMWGSNEFNKLALPGESIRGATKVIPANVRSVSCGEDFTIATLTNGRVLAVGKGAWGEVSSWFDVVGEPSRGYALTELWGSADPELRQRMKIIYADFSEFVLFLDDFYAFKFVPDLTSGFYTTKFGKIYSRYTAPFTSTPEGLKNYIRSEFMYMDVTFQETGFQLYEPLDFTMDGWGSQNVDAVVLSYQVEQLTTTTDDPNQTSTTLEPTTSTSTTSSTTTSTSSTTTEEPTTSTSTTSSTTEEPTTSTSTTSTSTTEEPTTSTTSTSTTEEPTTSTSTTSTSTTSTTIDPATIDTDNDGLNDAEDYFYTDEVEVVTKSELESFGFDSTSAIEAWDRIKFISYGGFPEAHPGMEPGEFYLIGDVEPDGWRVLGRDGAQVDSDGNILRVYSPDRGDLWEKLNNIPTTTSTTSTTSTSTTSTSTTSTSTTSTSTTSTSTTSTSTTTLEPLPYSLIGALGENVGRSLEFNTDGSILAIGSDTSIRVYSVYQNELTQLGDDIIKADSSTSSLALTDDGMTLVVGEPNVKQVSVYRFNGTTWSSESVPNPPENGSSVHRFGWDVDINSNGEVLIASDPWRDAGEDWSSGSVYVYFYNGVTWELTSSIEPTDLNYGSYFGNSISIDSNGSNFVAGAYGYGASIGYQNTGQVRHYSIDLSLNAYLEATIISSIGYDVGDRFGRIVSMSSDGQTFIVGSESASPVSNSEGRVEVFENISGTWTLKGQSVEGIQRREGLGTDVALTGDGLTFITGADGFDIVDGVTTYDAGKVEVYSFESGSWVLTDQILGTEGSENLGNFVAISRDGSIGAVSSPKYGDDQGAISLISIDQPTTTLQVIVDPETTPPPLEEWEGFITEQVVTIDTWWDFPEQLETDPENGCYVTSGSYTVPPNTSMEILQIFGESCGKTYYMVETNWAGENRTLFLGTGTIGVRWLPVIYRPD